jgi:L-threonylcarbamoyladenylate synthase
MSNPPFISNCAADTIRDAALALKAGHLVAFPTETVYGLGADARNPDAVKRIYEVKGRPTDHPLIIHISSMNQLDKWATDISEYAIDLARAFWPGPMTLILKRTDFVKDFITGGQNTVGLRVPSDSIAQSLLQEFEKISGSGIAAPSANRFGQVSPTSSIDVQEELGSYLSDTDYVLEGGKSDIGIESTIIDCTDVFPSVLRLGAITRLQISEVIGVPIALPAKSLLSFSGMFQKHYAPSAQVLLDVTPLIGDGMFALRSVSTPKGVRRIGSPENIDEYARDLYSALRQTDQLGLRRIVFIQPQGDGLAEGIRDRLLRASDTMS